ncbi:MAG: hypothetical protein EOM91_07425 [Sphingobacteriia bacterium]|nr:hypothetical protein [Sphingobacteriia bacterium]NCC39408.1 hypothetical protein [Gammaproteobacteria bacterium]
MSGIATRLTLVSALCLPLPAVHADAITDQLDAARQAYESGELRRAVDTLNQTVAKIQERITGTLLTLFPPPLEGWQAEEARAQSGGLAAMFTGTQLSRRYLRDEGGEVNLTLMADSPMMPMLTMAISMPMLMQTSGDMKPYTLKGERGVIEHAADSQDYKVTVMVGSRLMIQAEGSGLADATALDRYLEALDLNAIQDALTD